MHFRILALLFLVLMSHCEDTVGEKKTPVVVEQKPVQISEPNLEVYHLKTDPLIDSLLVPNKEFQAFTKSMENLIKLRPEGIAPFLIGAITKCNTLLKQPFPAPFDTPEIKSRLKVVKTELLKSRYYSIEEQQEELNQSFNALFVAYTAYLKRIEDFSMDLQEEQENEINLNSTDLN